MNRNLSPNIAKGIYGGPRQIKGADYPRANISQTSGAMNPQVSPIVGSAQGAYAQRNRVASK
jgi:hypothetical protein